MFPGSGDQKEIGRYLAIGQVGMEMVAPVALGWLADSYFGWSPWGVVVGAVLGFAGGMFRLVRIVNPKQRPAPADRTEGPRQGKLP
jgi:F0F1-type ATP synthase assembly protein I